jgi:hypothetical protein
VLNEEISGERKWQYQPQLQSFGWVAWRWVDIFGFLYQYESLSVDIYYHYWFAANCVFRVFNTVRDS